MKTKQNYNQLNSKSLKKIIETPYINEIEKENVALMDAISQHNLKSIDALLTISIDANILRNTDESGYNALFLSLMATDKPEISEKIADYIQNNYNTFDIVPLNIKQKEVLLSILYLPSIENMEIYDYFLYLKDLYFQYIYTADSLNEVALLLGAEEQQE